MGPLTFYIDNVCNIVNTLSLIVLLARLAIINQFFVVSTIYPTIYGSKNGPKFNNPSGSIIEFSGRIIDILTVGSTDLQGGSEESAVRTAIRRQYSKKPVDHFN